MAGSITASDDQCRNKQELYSSLITARADCSAATAAEFASKSEQGTEMIMFADAQHRRSGTLSCTRVKDNFEEMDCRDMPNLLISIRNR